MALAEKYERKAIIDIDFCGDPELMVFDDDGYCKLYIQNNDKLLFIAINGVQNNKLYFGETDRKLYHLKDKDGRQFFLFNVFRNDEKYSAQMYILEPNVISKGYSNEIFRCIKAGEQKLHIYGEEDGKVLFDYEQTAGEHYSSEYTACAREELYNVLHSKMQELTEQYTFIYGQFIMNGNSKLNINGMGCGIRTVKFIINGGTFYCDPGENGYPVLVKTKGASFLLEGNIAEESCSDRIMEYIEEEELYAICSEGKPVGKYSVTVDEK
ncbi:MAG: hypothetical protein ACI4J6_09620 [Oscillospiraceae bacterium]